MSACGTKKDITSPIAEEDIVKDWQAIVEYVKYYNGMEELKEDAEVVVLGKVIDIESIAISGTIWTKETVEVSESLLGDYRQGDIIYVCKQNGIVTLGEYAESLSESGFHFIKKEISQYDESDYDKKYVRMTNQGDPISTVDSVSVYFLYKTNTPEKLFPGVTDAYERVGAMQGEIRQLINGKFTFLHTSSSVEEKNNNLEISMSKKEGETLPEEVLILEKILLEYEDMSSPKNSIMSSDFLVSKSVESKL